ncbi:PQQ-binding-like beta-propeller repeat protein [Pseudoflavitalea sp. G-6-1-2]|uniref:PQQ-binding-like beta-propeller repeat protein n=1 Tax=Pseudoflavitalea sp. G-6-1-2 TaxID=2728841 RepID=UPI001469E8E5|nr:PQQ-binding-like beta-propeller repeat protein [Pseudoflavitalea sp. G-6-1-2]NML20721.1 PQQ-binding-like beta-propeller repeat protein [Pseudoflavitalea sp. G-6-1-2]
MRLILFCCLFLYSLSTIAQPVNAKAEWRVATASPIVGDACIDAGNIYFGNEAGKVFCQALKNGKLIWEKQLPGAVRSKPAVVNGSLIINCNNGVLYELNKSTGEIIWEFSTKGEKQYDFWDYYRSSPVHVNGLIYFGSGDYHVYAIDAVTGKERWKFATGGIVHADPAIQNDMLYIGSYDGKFYALNATTGQQLWQFKTIGDRNFPRGEVQKAALVTNEAVIFGSRDYNIYALNKSNGIGLWNMKEIGSWITATPLLHKNNLFFGTSDTHAFYSSSAEDGTVKWKTPIPFRSYNTPLVADSLILAGCFNGMLYAFDVTTGKIHWQFQTDGSKKNYSTVYDANGHFRKDFVMYGDNKVTGAAEKKIFDLGAVLATPVQHNGMLYFGATDGTFYAVKQP